MTQPSPSSSRPPYARRQVMLDQAVQGQLLFRVTAYWAFCLLATTVATWVWKSVLMSDPISVGEALGQAIPGAVGSLCFLPFVWADTLRWSNRFVGPVFSLRNALKRLEWGDWVPELKVRNGDHWNDLVDGFNQIVRRLPPSSRGTRHGG